jgi:hypothetical protein
MSQKPQSHAKTPSPSTIIGIACRTVELEAFGLSQLCDALKGDLGKDFERAIEISHDENLMAKVLYAERYARMLFDRELHDKLLQEVIDADIKVSNQTLINTIAKQKAVELLLDGDDYF